MEISELEGKLIGLCAVRKMYKNDVGEVRVSQATFLIKTQEGLKRGLMFLWNSDATRIQELVIGMGYKFRAAVIKQDPEMIIFFLPNQTQFKGARATTHEEKALKDSREQCQSTSAEKKSERFVGGSVEL